MEPKTITFVGNFEVPWSTESHHAWTWERMGHRVIKLQENRTNISTIIEACKHAQVFQYTHTHGWDIPGDIYGMCEEIKRMGLKSFSYHLDKYFGIGSRQANYLQHPSFHLDYFFSTDGGNDEGWVKAGINHVYLPPGVVEYACHYGRGSGHQIPVLFTGSRGYHGEYPFRPAMVAALEANYRERFVLRNGVREEPLNDLYATATVCVGDNIFAGCRMYCSDRLFETIGRGGFLVYPRVEGITDEIPGLDTYEPQNVTDLIHRIDYWLDQKNWGEREKRRYEAFEWVKANGTYTNRLTTILKVMGL